MARENKVTRTEGGQIRWSPVILRRLYQRRLAGESTISLAAEVGASQQALRDAFHRHGLALKHLRYPPRPAPDTLRQLWERRMAGEPTKALAQELGLKPNTITRYWRDIGLSLADRGIRGGRAHG